MRAKRLLLSIMLGVSAIAYAQPDMRIDPWPILIWAWPGISEVRVSPTTPTTASVVWITVCGWKPGADCQVYGRNVRVDGTVIWIDLYWTTLGMGGGAFTEYEYPVLVGMLDPGTYTVNATNHGALEGNGTTTFTVSAVSSLEPPGWLDLDDVLMPDPPGFEIQHVPWSQISSVKEGISQLRIEPPSPQSSDEVRVTISGWKPRADLAVERTTLRTEGKEIWLDLYWYTRPLVPPTPSIPIVGPGPGGSGILQAQSWNLGPPATVTQYTVAPAYEGVPFEYTERLGTLAWGTYTLHVASHDPVTGSAQMSFTVMPSTGVSRQPSWWQSLLQGTP